MTGRISKRCHDGSSHPSWRLLMFAIIAALQVSTTLATDERRILLDFFEATKGDQWLVNNNWASNEPICSWHGVSCIGGSENGDSEVDSLQLPENNVAGTVPATLYAMPLLRFLDLEGNPITNAGFKGFRLAGSASSPLETLALNSCNLRDIYGIGDAPASLNDLRLANNNLAGSFPEELFRLTSLRRLFVDRNSITGTLPTSIGKMETLIDFHAIGVPFQGAIPSELGLLNRMVTLVLRDNNFVGSIPKELNNMLNLEILSIGRSPEAGQGDISGPLPSFSNLPFLELLDLSLNKLTGSIPRDFLFGNQRTEDLVIVRLDGNQLTGTVPKQLAWIESMDLGLGGNKLEGPVPEELCEKKKWMTGLVEQFECNAILCPAGTYNKNGRQTATDVCQQCASSAASTFVGQTSCGSSQGSSQTVEPWMALAEFYVAMQGPWDNTLGWSSIDALLKLKKLEDLKATDIDYCSFYGVTCASSGDLLKIELPGNRLYGVVPSKLFGITTLTTFDLSSNRISLDGDGWEAISATNQLQVLRLSHTDVESLDGIGGATSLKELYLDGLSFESSMPPDLFTLANLQVLEVGNSHLRSSIPTLIGQLKNLKRLQLRWNDLTGAIPKELGALTKMEELGLAYNNFEGAFPSIDSMTMLRELELSRSSRGGLGGSIPDLTGLASLEVLGLDYNKFEGSIPATFLSGVADKTRSIKVGMSFNLLTGAVPQSLDAFSSMELALEGNMITELPSVFCDNSFWMGGYVSQATSGCNAILCPPGTSNHDGKENPSSLCLDCPGNSYYGATACGVEPAGQHGGGDSPATVSGLTEMAILDKLYQATNGDNWIVPHKNWTTIGVPACLREGVTCNSNGQVEALRMNRFGMNGQIPSEIFQLTANRILGFTENLVDLKFNGIEQSTRLEALLMSDTKLRSLNGLEKAPAALKTIHFAKNELEGPFPKSVLSMYLHRVFLNQNKLTGTIPAEISKLSELKELHLWDNKFIGGLPSELGVLSSLQKLQIGSNSLTGPIPDTLGQLSSLNVVDLSNQQGNGKLSGPLYPFASNPALTYLNVSMNNFQGNVPENLLAVADKSATITADLSQNEISGGVPEGLNSFQKLDINLAGNDITALPQGLCSLSGWMAGSVGQLQTCDAIMCAPGSYNSLGRQVNSSFVCQPCSAGDAATHFGSMQCGNSASIAERDILTKFYQTLNGDKWLSRFNWLSDNGVCTWFGVTCNDDLSIVELKLPSNQIVSTEDQVDTVALLFELPNLQVLDLKGNSVYLDFQKFSLGPSLQSLRVSGTGLKSLAGLSRATNLERLHATDNTLNGTVPEDIFALKKLKSLYLSFNGLRGTIPAKFAILTNLEELYMYGNEFEKSIPSELGSLQNLRELVLSHNYLSGVIPTEFNSMPNLEQLSLYDQLGAELITGPIPAFDQAPSLWYFDASDNDLTGSIPGNFLQSSLHLKDSITINLGNNDISGTLPESLSKFELLDLNLGGNNIVAIDKSLCGMSGWMKGNVGKMGCDAILCPQGSFSSNGRQTAADTPCVPCQDLKDVHYLGQTECKSFAGERGTLNLIFSMAGGDFWKRSDGWNSNAPICSWAGVKCDDGDLQDDKGVTAIKMDSNHMVGSLPTEIFTLPSLRELVLSGNKGLRISLDGISNAANSLEILQVSNTSMTSIEGISDARKLKELFIDENGLTGTFPEELFDLHGSLEKIRFSANYFFGTLPSSIQSMTNLVEFHAADNEFYSTIPSEIGALRSLQSLALNENLFYGEMPSELSEMAQLQILSVRREKKAGPKLFGKLPKFDKNPSLTVLFLDGNSLSGPIPENFLRSSSNVYLVDLKNNSLTGGVPVGLEALSELDIRLEGNQISTLPAEFCDNTNWMGGNVGRLKTCDAIVCPPQTASATGRALTSADECKPCADETAAPFYGSRSCRPIPTEREILVKLYDATNGAEWKRSDQWNTQADICDWYGVGCKDGRVILINLGANNLSGTPPPELFELKYLEILWLHSNPISFNFQGIGRSTALMDLRLDETSLTSVNGVGAAAFLTSLHVGLNSLEGEFPKEFLKLSNIRTLSVGGNKLSGPLPSFAGLKYLRTLRLDNNKFTGALPSFEDMHILSSIDISNNELVGTIPENFLSGLGLRTKLELDLSNNQLSGPVPSDLRRFPEINIVLRGNQIQGIPAELCAKSQWNDGDVGSFGCDAILCAPGTTSFDGRHSSRSAGCMQCSEAGEYYGQVACLDALATHSGSRTRLVGLSIFLALLGTLL